MICKSSFRMSIKNEKLGSNLETASVIVEISIYFKQINEMIVKCCLAHMTFEERNC